MLLLFFFWGDKLNNLGYAYHEILLSHCFTLKQPQSLNTTSIIEKREKSLRTMNTYIEALSIIICTYYGCKILVCDNWLTDSDWKVDNGSVYRSIKMEYNEKWTR